jgi:hypothetical protein
MNEQIKENLKDILISIIPIYFIFLYILEVYLINKGY